ncbi:hypothetical protein C464_16717 [Halorubrum coriense DSM 10284]|uniref:STAS/SEC14 domain-containing protein n=1 Tax=Halorubrum coriense DSM 10284 TaxID=1227466 RepID=M0E8P2_9EURY|nr:hypothetical protein [Halorubrum coriense]ELZ43388.1 hypothetical protein C464_16717 [Halorubrum coriense DSM 10284]
MPSQTTGDSWSYTQKGTVGIWKVDDWGKVFDEELQEAEAHFRETVEEEDIKGVIIHFVSADALGSETQSHINNVWSELTQLGDIIRAAYVADGLKGMAVESNVENPDLETESFKSLDEALEWAQEA